MKSSNSPNFILALVLGTEDAVFRTIHEFCCRIYFYVNTQDSYMYRTLLNLTNSVLVYTVVVAMVYSSEHSAFLFFGLFFIKSINKSEFFLINHVSKVI